MVAEQTVKGDQIGPVCISGFYIQFYSPQNKLLGHSLLFNQSLLVNFHLLVFFQSIDKKYTF
jgi:hypothetical protein